MKLLKTKTIRFSQIVEKCGQPNVYTLWEKPAADRRFQAQLKNSRVMTVQKSESGTDFGTIGFKERKGARYLVFPKSLKRFADKRVIGIDWARVRDEGEVNLVANLRTRAAQWTTLALFHPGGQASARLPRRCTCKCGTLSPASGPQLMTTR